MVRTQFIVVSDDQALIQKAQAFGQMHGVQVQVMAPEQYQTTGQTADVVNLVPGHGVTTVNSAAAGTGEGAKVLPFPGPQAADQKRGVATINQLESVAIENAIAAFKGNLTEAAKALGIGRATLYRKVKQYNIDPSMARKKKAA